MSETESDLVLEALGIDLSESSRLDRGIDFYAVTDLYPVGTVEIARRLKPVAKGHQQALLVVPGKAVELVNDELRDVLSGRDLRGWQFDWAWDWECFDTVAPIDVALALGAVRDGVVSQWPNGRPLVEEPADQFTMSGRGLGTCYGGWYKVTRNGRPVVRIYRADRQHGFSTPRMRLEVSLTGHETVAPIVDLWTTDEQAASRTACAWAEQALGVSLPFESGPVITLPEPRTEPSLKGAIRAMLNNAAIFVTLQRAGVDLAPVLDSFLTPTQQTNRTMRRHEASVLATGSMDGLANAILEVVSELKNDRATIERVKSSINKQLPELL